MVAIYAHFTEASFKGCHKMVNRSGRVVCWRPLPAREPSVAGFGFCLVLAYLLLICGAQRDALAESGQSETFVSYVGTDPLSVCWGSYAAPLKQSGSGKEGTLGNSRLVFWRGGMVWSRNRVMGPAWLGYLPQRSTLLWCGLHALHVSPLWARGRSSRFSAPAGFLFASYALAVEASGGGRAAVPTERFNAPYFHPLARFGVEEVDLLDGKSAAISLGGFPLGLGFNGNTLIVGTSSFPTSLTSAAQTHFYLDTFTTKRVGGKIILRRVSHKPCAGPLQSFAGGKPVLVTVGGHRVFVGGAAVHLGKKGRKVKLVVGEPGAVLVVKSDGSYGVAEKPRWIYRRLGSLAAGDLLGAGHNRTGFWLAQSAGNLGKIRITEVSKHGAIRTVNVTIASAARK